MGWELHAPLGPNSPRVLEIRETYAEIDSPRLGFVADFSSTMHSMSPTILRKLGKMGLGAGGARPAAGDLGDRRRHQRPARRVRRVPALARHRAGEPGLLRPAGVQHARARRPGRVGRHHAADQARARQVLRHRRARRRAGDRLPGDRPRVRATAATPASSPASGRATPSPTSTRPTRSTSSASSTTSSAGRSRPPSPTRTPDVYQLSANIELLFTEAGDGRRRPGPRRRGRGLRRRRDVVLDRQGPRLPGQGARRHRRAADLDDRRPADGLHLPGHRSRAVPRGPRPRRRARPSARLPADRARLRCRLPGDEPAAEPAGDHRHVRRGPRAPPRLRHRVHPRAGQLAGRPPRRAHRPHRGRGRRRPGDRRRLVRHPLRPLPLDRPGRGPGDRAGQRGRAS